MYSRFFNNFFNYCIYSLAILLAFLLVFDRFLEFPLVVSWLGHWHPLILHFPIVLVLVTVVQYWRKDAHASSYLAVTTLLTLVSAITGFVLSKEGGSKGDLLWTHQWIGVGVCFLLVIWYYFQHSISRISIRFLQAALVLSIVLTGHFGGMVTHGRDFLAFGKDSSSKVLSLPDDPNIYTHIVQPIFDRRCVSCHNENKAKGELILSSYTAVYKGGKTGSVLDESHGMNHRISLPLEDEDHMPPADEAQLEKDEITILKAWLDQGASAELMFSTLTEGSELQLLVGQLIKASNSNMWIDLPDVSDKKIAEIVSEYCTVKRMYGGSNALQVIVFPHQLFNGKDIEKLKPIAKNTVELNLSNLPLTEKEINFINNFENLEHLNLSGSTISDENYQALDNLKKLKTLKVYNTAIGDATLKSLSAMPSLSDLYVYNTNVSARTISEITDNNASLNIVELAPEALDFKSILPPPVPDPVKYFFREPYYLKLDHPLENIDIRFTLDGKEPDENSSLMQDSLLINKNVNLKFYAGKEGWQSSSLDSIQILKSDLEPVSYDLNYPADKKYLGTGKSLLFDLKKGPINFGDDAWMAFKDEPFSLTCEFEHVKSIGGVILSSMIHTDPYLFPPSEIKIYGGSNSGTLKLISSLKPEELREREDRHFKYYHIEFDTQPLQFLKIEVTPLRRIPMWHAGKGERGWFFIDEVIFVLK